MAHGVADPARRSTRRSWRSAQIVRRQALIMGFSDTFAVIGTLLAIAAVVLLFARKGKAGAGASGHIKRPTAKTRT